MSDVLIISLGLLAGALLGGTFFGGLWLTLNNLHNRRHPALWLLGSLALRLGLLSIALWLVVSHLGWRGLLAALVGLLLTRLLFQRQLHPVRGSPSP